MTPEQVEAIIEPLPEWSTSKKTPPFPVKARFEVEWETGLRPATIERLSVPEHFEKGKTHLSIAREIDKNRWGRELPLSELARQALDRVCPSRGVIFGRHDYRPLMRKAAAEVLESDLAQRFTEYDLRHARTTLWMEVAGDNPAGVAFLTAHTQITTLSRYTHSRRAAAESVLERTHAAVSERGLPTSSKPVVDAASSNAGGAGEEREGPSNDDPAPTPVSPDFETPTQRSVGVAAMAEALRYLLESARSGLNACST